MKIKKIDFVSVFFLFVLHTYMYINNLYFEIYIISNAINTI